MTSYLFLIILGLIMTIQDKDEQNLLLNSSIMQHSERWRIVNDDVMGGVSKSNVFISNGNIIFSGTVSLENNGGFASLRSPVRDYDFSQFTGLEIKLKADGKRYSISMKETSYFTGYFYTQSFETKKNKWITVKVPFDQFNPYYFGRKISSTAEIPLDKIKEISFLIGDKQDGEFIAEVDFIKLY